MSGCAKGCCHDLMAVPSIWIIICRSTYSLDTFVIMVSSYHVLSISQRLMMIKHFNTLGPAIREFRLWYRDGASDVNV